MSQLGQDRLENLLYLREALYRSERTCLDVIRQSQEMIDDINVSGSESEVSRASAGGMPYVADIGDFESLTHIIRSHYERLESNRMHVEEINMEIDQMAEGPAGA